MTARSVRPLLTRSQVAPWFVDRYTPNGSPPANTLAPFPVAAMPCGVPASPVPNIDEIVDDPERHMGVVSEANHPVIGPYRQIEPAARFSKSPQSVRRTAPMVAEHTREILSELGYDDGDIDRLIEVGAIAEPRPSSTRPQEDETLYPT